MQVNILAVGDVCGKVGLETLERQLRPLQRQKEIQFTVVNGENANGVGITPEQAERILDAGADVITLGNHTWARREIQTYLEDCPRILRPENFAPQVPGRGWGEFDTAFGPVCVLNLIGRCELGCNSDNPFFAADRVLRKTQAKLVLVDMHAEATSERRAMGYYLDGRASAVWGTHTHVQTSDGGTLPGGTGYISDLGMCGPVDSVLGMKKEGSISYFLGNPPQRWEPAGGPGKLECAIFTLEAETGACLHVETLRLQKN